MEIITSIKNPIIVKTLKIKKDCKNKIFLEGVKLILDALDYGLNIDYLLICKDKEEFFKEKYPFLFEKTAYIISNNVLNSLCDTNTPQGIVAIFDFKKFDIDIPKNNFIVLDNIQDPGNLGTIIRSASGTSFKELFLINCVNPFNQKVIRSSMGGIFKEKIYFINSIKDFISFATNNKLKLLVATMEGSNIFEFSKPESPFGLVVGNEGKGVSPELKNITTNKISIPMKNGLESLNAGVSCSIIIYCLDNMKSN